MTDFRPAVVTALAKKFIWSMRLEEFVAAVFLGPMIFFTIRTYLFFSHIGPIPKLFVGDMERLWAIILVIIITYCLVRRQEKLTFLRDILPFSYCLAIYTNLHDTVHFVNPNDIQVHLIAIDQWIFGVQPSVWAQNYVHPWLTETLSFCYMLFPIFTPLVAFSLYLQGKKDYFRETLVSVILCFYAGYLLYLIFPAVSPSISLRGLYTIKLNGTPISDTLIKIVNILPSDARDAFPSLHTAVTVLTMIFAFKYMKWEFWLLLPFGVGLIVATVYLREHYVIDVFAGVILAILSYFIFPKLDKWWRNNAKLVSQ